MTSTVGRTSTSNSNTQQNHGSMNQQGMLITMPEVGLIKTLHVWVVGDLATCTGQLCLWNSSGVLVAQTGNITFSSGSLSSFAWQVADLLTPYLASASQQLYIGFWRDPAATVDFAYTPSGGTVRPQISSGVANVSVPGNLSIGSSSTAQLSAYAEYVKGGLGYYNGSAFQKSPLNRYNGTSWLWHPLNKWSGSTWERYA